MALAAREVEHIGKALARDPAKPDYVQTVWGVGYKFAD